MLAKPARLLIRSVRQDAPLGRAGRLFGLGSNLALAESHLAGAMEARYGRREERRYQAR
nr:MAG TPA: hypothetical protein [Caudoviricetes sp.]